MIIPISFASPKELIIHIRLFLYRYMIQNIDIACSFLVWDFKIAFDVSIVKYDVYKHDNRPGSIGIWITQSERPAYSNT